LGGKTSIDDHRYEVAMTGTNRTRRNILKFAGALTVGLPLASIAQATKPSSSAAKPSARSGAARQFPKGFSWGTGTSSYQIEGARNEDGKGESIWDRYAHTPGNIKNNDTGDVANDHYHRYKEDVALMKRELGANAYRFSISWPRIFPNGTGQPNRKGLDFYSRLVDALRAASIEPFATLYHWDLPQTLQGQYRGWQSKDTAKAFADYAGYVAGQLSDRVKHFFTINEFRSFVEGGYQGFDVQVGGGKTVHLGGAPGARLSNGDLNQVRHHAVMGHGLAVQAIRARGRAGTKVGFAENMLIAVPFTADFRGATFCNNLGGDCAVFAQKIG
jgi:beta-glucosidase